MDDLHIDDYEIPGSCTIEVEFFAADPSLGCDLPFIDWGGRIYELHHVPDECP